MKHKFSIAAKTIMLFLCFFTSIIVSKAVEIVFTVNDTEYRLSYSSSGNEITINIEGTDYIYNATPQKVTANIHGKNADEIEIQYKLNDTIIKTVTTQNLSKNVINNNSINKSAVTLSGNLHVVSAKNIKYANVKSNESTITRSDNSRLYVKGATWDIKDDTVDVLSIGSGATVNVEDSTINELIVSSGSTVNVEDSTISDIAVGSGSTLNLKSGDYSFLNKSSFVNYGVVNLGKQSTTCNSSGVSLTYKFSYVTSTVQEEYMDTCYYASVADDGTITYIPYSCKKTRVVNTYTKDGNKLGNLNFYSGKIISVIPSDTGDSYDILDEDSKVFNASSCIIKKEVRKSGNDNFYTIYPSTFSEGNYAVGTYSLKFIRLFKGMLNNSYISKNSNKFEFDTSRKRYWDNNMTYSEEILTTASKDQTTKLISYITYSNASIIYRTSDYMLNYVDDAYKEQTAKKAELQKYTINNIIYAYCKIFNYEPEVVISYLEGNHNMLSLANDGVVYDVTYKEFKDGTKIPYISNFKLDIYGIHYLPERAYIQRIKGDWNNDGQLSIIDINLYRKYLAGVEETVSGRYNDKYSTFDYDVQLQLNFDGNTSISLSDLIQARIALANK